MRTQQVQSAHDFIACTLKELPADSLVLAAETARSENPNNAPALDAGGLILPPSHLAVLTTKYWGVNGVKLSVGFMEPIQNDLRDRILSHMNAWSEFCNFSFVWSKVDPQVRITREGDGYWSYLGTDILHIPKNQPTMCLQAFSMSHPESEFRRVVAHEAGHTGGFPHEHMRTELVSRLDVQKTIAYFQRTQGWSAQTTRQQVLTPMSEVSLRGTPHADQDSLMCYNLPGAITIDGQPIRGGADIDELDAAFAASIYPKPEQPVSAGDGLALSLDFKTKTATVKLPAGWRVVKG